MLEKLGNYQDAFDILLKEFQYNLELVYFMRIIKY